MTIQSSLLALLLILPLTGCGVSQLFGIQIKADQTLIQKPNDVSVVVTVQDGRQPVANLGESNFDVYENNLLLSHQDIQLRLLSRDTHIASLTVLLLDLSGNPQGSELRRIERGASHFVEKVSVTQPVIVVAYDGSQKSREVARYSKVDQATERPVPPLDPFLSEDSSRDLNTAIVGAITALSGELKQYKQAVHFGTVVTLLRGPDLAGRTSEDDLKKAIKNSGYEFYSISPEGQSITTLGKVGNTEQFHFATMDTLPMRLSDLGMRVRSAYNSHYVLSYCSPARSGDRSLKISVNIDGTQAGKKSGSTKTKFDSTGFEGGCSRPLTDSDTSRLPPSEPPHSSPVPPRETVHIGSSEQNTPQTDQENDIAPPPDTGKYE